MQFERRRQGNGGAVAREWRWQTDDGGSRARKRSTPQPTVCCAPIGLVRLGFKTHDTNRCTASAQQHRYVRQPECVGGAVHARRWVFAASLQVWCVVRLFSSLLDARLERSNSTATFLYRYRRQHSVWYTGGVEWCRACGTDRDGDSRFATLRAAAHAGTRVRGDGTASPTVECRLSLLAAHALDRPAVRGYGGVLPWV